MNILLVQPSETNRAMIHLGLGYVAAALESRGDRVKILDKGIIGGSVKKTIRFIEEFSPDVVGITAQTPYYSKGLNMSQLVKKINPDCPILLKNAENTDTRPEAVFWGDRDDMIQKPFAMKTLSQKIRTVLDRTATR